MLVILLIITIVIGSFSLFLFRSQSLRRRLAWSQPRQWLVILVGIGVLALWAFSPRFIELPVASSTYPLKLAPLAIKAEKELRSQLESWDFFVLRFVTQRAIISPEGYQLCGTSYTFFYLQWSRWEVHFDQNGEPRGGSTEWSEQCRIDMVRNGN